MCTATAAKVLIADDNATTVEGTAKLLVGAGYRCISARGGAAAYRTFCAERPDLVITDLNMAGGDGYVLIDRVREISGAPILVITGTNTAYARQRVLDVFENTALVAKPFGREKLLQAVAALLSKAESMKPEATAVAS